MLIYSMLYDFHTHTFNSDGVLSAVELIRRAAIRGYSAIAITDHIGIGSLERVIREVSQDCELARSHWNILAIPGVELTHLPHEAIDEAAKKAKELGAWLVVVHGETSVEPVEPGTNLAAVRSSYVDILAHPGYITEEVAGLAAAHKVFLEITTRRGHSLTNAHVAKIAGASAALMLLNSDSHCEDDLLSEDMAKDVLRKAGVSSRKFKQILESNPLQLLQRIRRLP
ncbi:MAG: histidinol phosphate phosphatase domain-containing protein [Dehalococcoidia bacterium]|nr:histidinol phosphate phosphatase domain-containing protein [Dehalococcoidia bacterium]MDD5493502.1 histidinol phosphate phosphatase domain-containing protein [Dehalococcoidia bacterium]